MIPIALDPRFARLAVAGNGPLALRRFRALRAAGAADALLFSDAPDDEAVVEAGTALRRAMPGPDDLAVLHVLWIVDLPRDRAEALAAAARARHLLVNVEDVPPLCDFHSVAEVRRGDLLLTISTNGRAPGLAGVIRRNLELRYGPEWAGRVAEIGALREGWRREGVTMPEAAKRIATLASERNWLCDRVCDFTTPQSQS
ncbi:precorrin-2 dehydrogenase/sirohydrochlorin ferrochelatase family protein [Acidiphilium acidophilum]|uniref:precorrin-2 dehydrogenase n=1 Tax=Acidiphilium acidophilum TaxID=76588 RepID=A0AAW9DT27_ACIAO|nr:NAD(P)-dependent oxidoreductase [Acidiphilium acidophilum]MDX5932351.1 NAD(P)-dependent oxidoreductase [Acidiphilium acidophilum]